MSYTAFGNGSESVSLASYAFVQFGVPFRAKVARSDGQNLELQVSVSTLQLYLAMAQKWGAIKPHSKTLWTKAWGSLILFLTSTGPPSNLCLRIRPLDAHSKVEHHEQHTSTGLAVEMLRFRSSFCASSIMQSRLRHRGGVLSSNQCRSTNLQVQVHHLDSQEVSAGQTSGITDNACSVL